MKESSWATYGMMEAPFWNNGMTPIEYEIELAYLYGKIMREDKVLSYKPLWKQENSEQVEIKKEWATPYMQSFDFWYEGITVGEYKIKFEEYFEELHRKKSGRSY